MGKNILKIIVIACIIFLFLSTAHLPVLADDNICVQQDKVLTKEHIKYLFRGFLFINDFKIKNVIIKIILEINRVGSATSEEIQEIIDSNNVNLDVYILAQIKTTGIYYNASDGSVRSVPWRYSFPLFNFHNAKGIFVDYTPECIDTLYGWTLQVDGNSLGENDGYILGYTGFINNYMNLIPESQYSTFKLDGFCVLILHEKNI